MSVNTHATSALAHSWCRRSERRQPTQSGPSGLVIPERGAISLLFPIFAANMRRRQFIRFFGGTAVAWPLAALAQVSPKRRPLIAWLSGGTSDVVGPFAANFLDGLRDLGYVEGHDFDMVSRLAEGFLDRLPALAEESFDSSPI
jgi:hypothetical protein